MKIGDKIYCIKNRNIYVISGNIYTILDINYKNDIIITSVENNYKSDSCDFKIIVNHNDDNTDYYIFSNYFITLKEHRKQKLKKINSL